MLQRCAAVAGPMTYLLHSYRLTSENETACCTKRPAAFDRLPSQRSPASRVGFHAAVTLHACLSS